MFYGCLVVFWAMIQDDYRLKSAKQAIFDVKIALCISNIQISQRECSR